jgi:protein O-GlcNAc transferase
LTHEPRDASRAPRVGFISGDLRSHPVGHFLEGVLAHWPHERVRLVAYPTFALEDEATARMRPHFESWTPIAHLDDAQAAARIAADRIDVLVDLAGHTAHNRLPLFAWRPARVQASWLGYFATTGIEQMDWLLSDATSIAPGEERHYGERIWRLPGTRLCFTPPRQAPAVAPLPALATGSVTFGSFQNLGKIGDEVLALWARVLRAVPDSRLRVQNAQVADDEAQRALQGRLAALGIAPSRVSLHGKQPRAAYLRAHAEVDIVLDTFPYPGGTTTCEALWMGVPTVTLSGSTMLARQGESLLAAAAMPDWIARDADGYVRIATSRSADLASLASLRAGLRDHVAASPLFDAKRFAGELADAFIGMHRAA